MKTEVVLPIIAGILVVLDLVTRKKRNISALLAFGREKGWHMLLIDAATYPKPFRSRGTMTYAARYRAKDDSVHEAILAVGWAGSVTLLEEKKPSPGLARALADSRLSMDCRQCGSQVPAGMDQCPYCKSWRHTFKTG